MKSVTDLPLVLPNQTNLFGDPPLRPELSQWHTPQTVARRLARWVPKDAHVLEPSCGSGNLISALIETGHDPRRIIGIELDPAWARHALERFARTDVHIVDGDFLQIAPLYSDHADVVLMNPPFEDGGHVAFVERALEISSVVIGIFPVTIEFGAERDRDFWAKKAKVVRRARVPNRVKYGGAYSANFETVALEIVRRDRPRAEDEVLMVREEVWST